MRNFLLLSLLTLAVEKASSQANPWEKCGGDPWTGPTTCVTGYYCSFTNKWFSQCLPGSPPVGTTTTIARTTSATLSTVRTTTSTLKTSVVTTKALTTSASSSPSSSSVKPTTVSASASASTTVSGACPAFTSVAASAAIAALKPGWNLGNTLDAVPDEGSWNNPPATLLTLQQIKAKGFNSVRVPVTWTHHFDSEGPDYVVNAAWMNRVEVVIDQALSTGLWVILNVHHDSWGWMDYAAGMDIPVIEAKFAKLWTQIGTRFKCKSSKLIFEAINEPTGTTEAHAIELNKLNDIFLTSINVAGGNNPQRVVSLSGLNQDATRTSQWFKRGTLYPNQPWALQFHYYSPYDFVFDAWGRTIWGSAADKAVLTAEFQLIKGNFSDVPTFIGEWDASPLNTEPAARWTYNDYLLKEANRLGFSTVLWDNGLDHFNRASNTFYDPVAIDIILKATAGVSNALPDATTDTAATTQSSSAFLFHKVGAAVTPQSVKYNLNGNKLVSIKTAAGAVVPASSYAIAADGTLTFTSAYLGSLYTASAPAGIKGTLNLTFSAGTSLQLQIVQYDTPTTPSTTLSLASISGDTTIPLAYKGLPVIAAVKALKADGTYLLDDWTQFLGPLQQARWTQGQWFWNNEGFMLYATGLAVLKAAGQKVTVTLEFFPRVPGNEIVLVFNP